MESNTGTKEGEIRVPGIIPNRVALGFLSVLFFTAEFSAFVMGKVLFIVTKIQAESK